MDCPYDYCVQSRGEREDLLTRVGIAEARLGRIRDIAVRRKAQIGETEGTLTEIARLATLRKAKHAD